MTHVRALCCDCGNLRYVSARYAGRREPSDTNRSRDDGSDPRGWRMTRTLKASTVHALLRDDLQHCRDVAEDREHRPIISSATTLTRSLDTDRLWHSKRVHWPVAG
jgi:hypothetical protein